ncbi:antibiotic biosynthesis monooxygenase family protein [Streptococcus gallolyticus]|uniref:ABM domain-containing protein n=1 Tax=Streptococcus gallolyticus TaxID=315405 RepID=A0A139R389_9STRE|nr:antibiotic biosynthesis monooxygenase [Streptococcus gallolyticus]KXT64424.1 hypothetical protein SGADD02_02054 [Streptococcus gallolyticus]KXU09153.1 hypothetical protein SGADD03_01008 [Streptococcus gallolyticus]
MLIKTITFEIKANAKNKFEQKLRSDNESLQNWDTCLDSEVWYNGHIGRDTVAFTVISRWNNQEDFNVWFKDQQQIYNCHKGDSPIIQKISQEYITLDN